MLIELICDKFFKQKIEFNKNLNIVLGDKNASNSIGKSTFLMIIDFILGGSKYLTHNKDVLDNIGEHEFYYTFEFNSELIKFKRKVSRLGEKQSKIYLCDINYEEKKEISLANYTNLLKRKYNLNNSELSFRDLIGLYSRIWGKNNYDIKKPLHVVPMESGEKSINRLIKLFLKYQEISNLEDITKISKKTEAKFKFLFNEKEIKKISETKFKKNENEISNLNNQIKKLEENILEVETKLSDEKKIEIFKLKALKNEFNDSKTILIARKEKLIRHKVGKNNLKTKEINKLKEYFPNINENKIKEVENFHKGISKLLKDEIAESLSEIDEKINSLNSKTTEINNSLEELLKKTGNSSKLIIDKVSRLLFEKNNLEKENNSYDTYKITKKTIKDSDKKIKDYKIKALDEISKIVNKRIREINEEINPNKSSPVLILSEKNYSYLLDNNTGTGKGYENLFLFDLAILKETNLPLLIHDSFLFKNLAIDITENLLNKYLSYNKQIFIAIDESERYNQITQNKLKLYKVLELSKEQVLFGKIWSDKN